MLSFPHFQMAAAHAAARIFVRALHFCAAVVSGSLPSAKKLTSTNCLITRSYTLLLQFCALPCPALHRPAFPYTRPVLGERWFLS
jgi:hypothetical protein